jgi:hypothetical protein
MRPAIFRSSIMWTNSHTDLVWNEVAIFASWSVSWSRLLSVGIAVSIAWSRTDNTLPVLRAINLPDALGFAQYPECESFDSARTSPSYKQSTMCEIWSRVLLDWSSMPDCVDEVPAQVLQTLRILWYAKDHCYLCKRVKWASTMSPTKLSGGLLDHGDNLGIFWKSETQFGSNLGEYCNPASRSKSDRDELHQRRAQGL